MHSESAILLPPSFQAISLVERRIPYTASV
jgi:hypothetical protein